MRKLTDLAYSVQAAVRGSPALRAGLPAALAAGFCCYHLLFPGYEHLFTELNQIDFGGVFLAGVPFEGVALNMPLPEVLVSALLNLRLGPDGVFAAIHLALYALVFFAGCLLHGYWAGLLALAAAGAFGMGRELVYEQAIYSCYLLLVLCALRLFLRERTPRQALLCGLAVGASMLSRTPLFAFPPLLAAADWLTSPDGRGRALRRAAVLLAASYALLLPWGWMNYSLDGKFRLMDSQRSSNNVLAAALGHVYSLYGNTRKAAGLEPHQSALAYYAGQVAEQPLLHARLTARRLWHSFLFYPVLFSLALLALAADRRRESWLLYSLPAYLFLVHLPLALEKRYFYPLPYLLPPLLAASFLPRRFSGPAEAVKEAEKGLSAAFAAALAAAAVTGALVLAYPYRAKAAAGKPGLYAAASARLPYDRRLHQLKCRELWLDTDDAGFRRCLAGLGGRFQDRTKPYHLALINARDPEAVRFPPEAVMNADLPAFLILRMLRQFELGRTEEAMRSYRLAFRALHSPLPGDQDWQHMDPYPEDASLRKFITADEASFWDGSVYEHLLLWPPAGIRSILDGVARRQPLSPAMSRLRATLREAGEGDSPWLRAALRRGGGAADAPAK